MREFTDWGVWSGEIDFLSFLSSFLKVALFYQGRNEAVNGKLI